MTGLAAAALFFLYHFRTKKAMTRRANMPTNAPPAAAPAIKPTLGPGVDEVDGSRVVVAVAVAGVPLVIVPVTTALDVAALGPAELGALDPVLFDTTDVEDALPDK